MEPVKYIKEMLKVQEGTIADGAVDIGLGAIPMLGEAFQSYRISKLEKRMKINLQQLETIKNKVESSKNEVFYKSEVFPLIVKQIMDEDEDEKVTVIIDGFEHIVNEDFKEIEKIYHYYDVLAELRYNDILMLCQLYKKEINLVKNENTGYIKNELNNTQEIKAISKYQTNKLKRLGLVKEDDLTFGKKIGIENGSPLYSHAEYLTDFGNYFVQFFALEK